MYQQVRLCANLLWSDLDSARPPLRTSAEPEPVMPTVNHAEIRGLGTTLLGAVRRLPRL
jgi:hypothetical protein